jgi:hypothetical protein
LLDAIPNGNNGQRKISLKKRTAKDSQGESTVIVSASLFA